MESFAMKKKTILPVVKIVRLILQVKQNPPQNIPFTKEVITKAFTVDQDTTTHN